MVGWRWHPTEGVKLSLAEITSAIFTPAAELVGRDPAPDSSLPAPWSVATLTGLAVTSATTAVVDGSILTRTSVTWTAAVSQAIRRGGSVEVQYTPAASVLPTGDWPSWEERGDSTSAVIPGLLSRYYVFRARFANSLRVRGAWSAQVLHLVASTRAPKIYRQTTAPSGAIEGDTWFDTNDGNKQYVRASGAWVAVLVGTGGLDLESATEVHVDTPASPVTVTEVMTTPDAYGRNDVLASLTFTPSATGIASVFAEAQGTYINASGSSADCQYSIQQSGVAYDDWKERYENTGPGVTRSFPMQTTRRINVTGGVSYTFGFLAAKLNPGDTFSCKNIEMRVEVIKR